jgi:HK97 family phage major capsid protein
MAMQMAAPENTLGRVDNVAQVKAVAEQLYPTKTYGVKYDELRWKHWQAFGKWVRGGSGVLDATERKIAFGGRIILTDRQIATALRSGFGPAQLKDLVEGSDTAGGFLVPEDFRAEIIRGLPDAVVMRPRARVVQTSRDVVKAPKVTGNGNSYSSAVRLTWGPETPAAGSAETDPTFGQVAIPVHTAMASTQLSLDLMEDAAIDVAGLLRELYTEAFALGEDDEFLTGDGNGKPQGITQAAAAGTITAVNTGHATLLTADGLLDLQYALPPQYWPNAVFCMNATSAGRAIRKMKDGNGDYLWQRGLAAGQPDMLLGKPVAYSAFMPDVAASVYPVWYGDPRFYWIVDRVGMTLQRLAEMYAEQNMVGFVARKRVGGQVVLPAAFRAQYVSA